jgi:O-antigen ligase
VLLVALLLTKTRSAWVAVAILFVMYAGLFDRRYLLGILLLPMLLAIPGVDDRIADLQTNNTYVGEATHLNSFSWRLLLWEFATDWILARPIAGYGLESFRHFSPMFFPLSGNYEFAAHNVYVQLLFEAGALGLLAFLLLFFGIIMRLKARFRADPSGSCMLFAMILGFLVGCFADNMLHYLPFMWYFWFILGTACANARLLSAESAWRPHASASLPQYSRLRRQ